MGYPFCVAIDLVRSFGNADVKYVHVQVGIAKALMRRYCFRNSLGRDIGTDHRFPFAS
jgi:hypothetical protein